MQIIYTVVNFVFGCTEKAFLTFDKAAEYVGHKIAEEHHEDWFSIYDRHYYRLFRSYYPDKEPISFEEWTIQCIKNNPDAYEGKFMGDKVYYISRCEVEE